MKARVEPWLTKFVLPAAGALGFYLGAFAAIYFLSGGGSRPSSGLAAFGATAGGGVGGGFLALWACDALLGPSASHVDVLKTLFFMVAAALGLSLVDAALLKLVDRSLPVGLETLALWSSGVAAVWRDEPGGVNWPKLVEALKGLRPR